MIDGKDGKLAAQKAYFISANPCQTNKSIELVSPNSCSKFIGIERVPLLCLRSLFCLTKSKAPKYYTVCVLCILYRQLNKLHCAHIVKSMLYTFHAIKY